MINEEDKILVQFNREQIADLLLKDPEGRNLVFCSPITHNADGSMSFEVKPPPPEEIRYKVTLKIEEI